MKEEILNNLENPRQLEKLYRDNKTTFKKEFTVVYPEIREKTIAQVWNERLHFEEDEISWGAKSDLMFVIATAIIAGLIAKIPDFAGLKPEFFYVRNISFIFLPMLTIYFAWKNNMQLKNLLIVSAVFIVSACYINFLPVNPKSDTLMLACIHLPLLIWATLGFSFAGGQLNNYEIRLDFLRYNGDLIVMTAIILLAAGLLTAVTIGLFELIGIKIGQLYFEYFGIWGLSAAPIFGSWLVRTNPHLVNKVSPIIAKIFTPLVLVMLVIYLVTIVSTGKDPYNDRDFLMVFNLLLVGVMAIILFSVSETSDQTTNRMGPLLLLALSVVTIIVNGIALSAIIFRINEWGITPNRLAVLGGNMLILVNLLIVTYRLSGTVRNKNKIDSVGISIAAYLPVYVVWTIIVIFLFPVIFSFK